MRETIDHLIYLNNFHWRGNAYQWFLYFGIFMILIFEKRKMVRIVFGWVPLFYLVSIFNPITLKLLKLAGLYNDAYFTRLFSFMPLMYVITCGFSLFLRLAIRMKSEWIKMAGVCTICGIIYLTGHNIYSESWLTKAENSAKVPQDTIEIAEAVKADPSAKIATIDENAVYLRQIADVIMPYGRVIGELGEQLSVDPPDVQKVMEMAGQQDVEYICAHKSTATLNAFSDNGYEPYALTSNYAIYKVEGVPRAHRTVDTDRRIVRVGNLDSEGEEIETEYGYNSITYQYDSSNNVVRESYLDCNGHPFQFPDGHSSMEKTYYTNGWVKTLSYQDTDGNPMIVDGRYKTKYRYNKYGYTTQETYYDTNGNIIGEAGKNKPKDSRCLRFCHKTKNAELDEEGNITFTTNKEDNRFSATLFQLYDADTGAYVAGFGEAYEEGLVEGQYVHPGPDGLYRMLFKGNTNISDEYIQSLEELSEGETLYYRYNVDALSDRRVEINGLYIGRAEHE